MPLITSSAYFVQPILTDARGVNINGVGGDGFRNTANWTTGADNKFVTFSCWFKCDNASNNMIYLDGYSSTSHFRIRGSRYNDKANIQAFNSSATVILTASSSLSLVDNTDLHHVLFTADLSNASNRQVWVDGVVDAGATYTHYVNNNIDWVHNQDQKMLDGWNGPDNFQGAIAEMWFTNEYIGTAASNVNKFYIGGKPADLGSDGSLPTGNQPIAYYSVREGDTVSDWGVNRGSGPDFFVLGTPTIATLW